MFEEAFQAAAQAIDQSLERMIWRIAAKYADLSEAPLAVDSATAYAIMDGTFQHALIRHLSGDESAAGALSETVRALMPALLAR